LIKSFGPALLLSGMAFLAAPLVYSASSHALAASALTAADTDSDGTLDLNEVKAAAAAEFDKLDTDKDGTIDAKEADDHVDQANFAAADSDKDGTLTKDEYVALAASLFKSANPDGDNTVDANELHSDAGTALGRAIQ
jgi:Ca2+-binding EF-hand superfamily protein